MREKRSREQSETRQRAWNDETLRRARAERDVSSRAWEARRKDLEPQHNAEMQVLEAVRIEEEEEEGEAEGQL